MSNLNYLRLLRVFRLFRLLRLLRLLRVCLLRNVRCFLWRVRLPPCCCCGTGVPFSTHTLYSRPCDVTLADIPLQLAFLVLVLERTLGLGALPLGPGVGTVVWVTAWLAAAWLAVAAGLVEPAAAAAGEPVAAAAWLAGRLVLAAGGLVLATAGAVALAGTTLAAAGAAAGAVVAEPVSALAAVWTSVCNLLIAALIELFAELEDIFVNSLAPVALEPAVLNVLGWIATVFLSVLYAKYLYLVLLFLSLIL